MLQPFAAKCKNCHDKMGKKKEKEKKQDHVALKTEVSHL